MCKNSCSQTTPYRRFICVGFYVTVIPIKCSSNLSSITCFWIHISEMLECGRMVVGARMSLWEKGAFLLSCFLGMSRHHLGRTCSSWFPCLQTCMRFWVFWCWMQTRHGRGRAMSPQETRTLRALRAVGGGSLGASRICSHSLASAAGGRWGRSVKLQQIS